MQISFILTTILPSRGTDDRYLRVRKSLLVVGVWWRATDLPEELLNELLSPAEVKAPRLGRVTDVCRVNDQSQSLRLINAAETHSQRHSAL